MPRDSRRLPLSFTNQAGSYFSNHGLAGPAFSEPRLISPAWCIISIWTAAVGDLLARATWKNHGHSEAAGRHRVTDARIRGSTLESPSMLARRGETYRNGKRKVSTTLPVQAPHPFRHCVRAGRRHPGAQTQDYMTHTGSVVSRSGHHRAKVAAPPPVINCRMIIVWCYSTRPKCSALHFNLE